MATKALNLRGEWRLETIVVGGTDTTADSSGNGFDGTCHEDLATSSGKFGNSIDFPGTDGRGISVGAPMTIGADGSWALECWFTKSSAISGDVLIGNQVVGGGQSYNIQLVSKVLWAQSVDSNSVNESRAILAGDFPDELDHHVVYTRDGSGNKIYAYLDAVEKFSVADNRTGHFTAAGANTHWIGGIAASSIWSDRLEEVRFWDRYLLPHEIPQLMLGFLHGGM